MFTRSCALLIIFKIVLISESKAPLNNVLGLFDMNTTRSNVHLILLSSQVNCVEFFPRRKNEIQTYMWVNLNDLVNSWANPTQLHLWRSLIMERHKSVVIIHPETQDEFFLLVYFMPPGILKLVRRVTVFVIWPDTKKFNSSGDEQVFMELLRSHKNTTTLKVPLNMNLYFVFFAPPSCESFPCNDSAIGNSTNMGLNGMQVYELYSIQDIDYFQLVPCLGDKIDMLVLSQKLMRRGQFNRVEIPAVADDDMNLAKETAFKPGSTLEKAEFLEGSAVSMYWDIRDMLNLTEKAYPGSSLSLSATGQPYGRTWNLISSRQAIISISQITMLTDRAHFVTFLQPTSYGNGIQAFFVQPPLNSMRNVFFTPFGNDVWLTMGLTWLSIIVLMMFISLVKGYFAHPEQPSNSCDTVFVQDAFIWAIGALCQKGWPKQPRCASMRIVFFIGCLTGLLLYIAYSAAIVSVLSVKHVPVKSFAELLSYDFKYYAHEKSTTTQSFLRDNIIRDHHLSQEVLKTDTANEVNILLKSTNSMISFPDVFYTAARTMNFTERFLCESISSVPASSYTSQSSMFVRKGSPFIETLNYKIMMLKERGFNHRYFRRYVTDTRIICSTSTLAAQGQRLNYTDLYTAFLIIICGYVISMTFLALEKGLHHLGEAKVMFLSYCIATCFERRFSGILLDPAPGTQARVRS